MIAQRRDIYQKRFKRFLELAVKLDMNRPGARFQLGVSVYKSARLFHAASGCGRERKA